MKFKRNDRVVIRAIPVHILAYRKSIAKLVGKTATVIEREYRITQPYYKLLCEDKELWLHELNLEAAV